MKISRFNLLKLAIYLFLIWKALTPFLLPLVTTYLYFPLLLRLPHAKHFLMDTVGSFMRNGIPHDRPCLFL